MNNNKPLLSICIPTFNRGEYLRGALENIVNDPAFDEDVEIVISDNASTDTTGKVAMEFTERFPNIKYFRNDENLKDGNFILCLCRATGKYRKLSNDTLRYKPGTLAIMKEEINRSRSGCPLYFYQEIPWIKGKKVELRSPKELVGEIAYFVGWIASFGIWEEDLDMLDVDPKYTKMQFVQVAWVMEILNKHNEMQVIFGDFYEVDEPKRKAGYNLFKVHLVNLFSILREYGGWGAHYERARFRALRYQSMALIKRFLIDKKETGFDLTDSWKTVFRCYWWRLYLYPGLLLAWMKRDKGE